MRTCRERVERRGEFDLNDPQARGVRYAGNLDAVSFSFNFCRQAEREIAFEQLGISCRFVFGNRVVVVAVNLGQHFFGDVNAGCQVDLQSDDTGFDGHKRRLQILVKPMAENGGWKRKEREQQRQATECRGQRFHHFAP